MKVAAGEMPPATARTAVEPTRTKGDATRAAILDVALALSTESGLEGLTIGVLATKAGMSKSGLYAHFASKEDLQCAVLDTAAADYIDTVVAPALAQPRGLPRLEKLLERWMHWERDAYPGGCPFIIAMAEFDDRPGRVRDKLKGYINDLVDAIARAASIAVDEGHFRSDLDTRAYAYEYWAALMAYQQFRRLLDATDAESLAVSSVAALNARAASGGR